jgi:hypothetical protein
MGLLFIDKVKENKSEFSRKVTAIAKKYRFNPSWLMAVINNETGGTFNPAIPNGAGSGAVGLIQFMPDTARDLGTTTTALANMSNVVQLDYVDKYISKMIGYFKVKEIADYDDLYFLVFYPGAIGKPDNWVFPQNIYSQNRGVDVDKDGKITVADFKAFIRRMIPASEMLSFVGKDTRKKAFFVFVIICVVTLGVAVYLFFRKK